jgi:endoglucanase
VRNYEYNEAIMITNNTRSTYSNSSIHLNQAGYRTADRKTALITGKVERYQVYSNGGDLVYEGTTTARNPGPCGMPTTDKSSGDALWEADFTNVTDSGTYYIQAGNDRSPSFVIGDSVYSDLTKAVLKMFYYQRCGGSGISGAYAGRFAHGPCHLGNAAYFDPDDPVYGGTEADVSGGWHDAGDYGRYITPAAKAVTDLMMACELFPGISSLDFGGPLKLPQEIRYELEWMLKMQHPVTGGVYHKVTTQNHAPFNVMPEGDHAQLYLSPVSAQATGSFAAAMARASRFFRRHDPVFADKCITAAEKAWKWLMVNPRLQEYRDPSFFRTGAYGDTISFDERCWAAAELFSATGADGYLSFLDGSPLPQPGFGWTDNGSYAMTAYLLSDKTNKNSDLYNRVKECFLDDADHICKASKNDGYGISLEHYPWGSNMTVANNAMTLLLANVLKPDPDYINTALDHFHYLMGRNANGISYVTGCGEHSVKGPHHRPSMVLGVPVPGMLAGGPFEKIMDLERDPASGLFKKDTPPAKCYADVAASFSSNEICIYWNSPLAFILAFLNEGYSNEREQTMGLRLDP